ncbi:conserved hypothetical protein [Candidatus Sulfopaludibacter sp. SbA3]|nr:conserved hypothetical protein [Candidatus Sulfopaludibacter sp. SbA3]
MLVLFDHGTPRSIARFLAGHSVTRAKAKGWDKLSDGKLQQAAEEAGFDVLLTTDKKIRYQQNLPGRRCDFQSDWQAADTQNDRVS